MLVVFFDWKGIVHHEFVPRGQMVNEQLYREIVFVCFVFVTDSGPIISLYNINLVFVIGMNFVFLEVG
jgi:hypothetical protein